LEAKTSSLNLAMDTMNYAKNLAIDFVIPFSYDMKTQMLNMQPTKASVNGLALNLEGTLQTFANKDDVAMDLLFSTEAYSIKQLLALVPASYLTALKDLKMDGDIATKGSVKGVFNNQSMPVIDLNVDLADGVLAYNGFPYTLNKVVGNVDVWLNMNKASDSKVTVNTLSARTGKSTIEGKGFVDYILMDNMLFDLDLQMRLNLPELEPMIPKDLKLKLAGIANGSVKTRFMLQDAVFRKN
jgi:hypothetical protein